MVILARYYYYFYLLIGSEQKLRGQRTASDNGGCDCGYCLRSLHNHFRRHTSAHTECVPFVVCLFASNGPSWPMTRSMRFSWECRVICVCAYCCIFHRTEQRFYIFIIACFRYFFSRAYVCVCLFGYSFSAQQSDGGAKCRWKLNNTYMGFGAVCYY